MIAGAIADFIWAAINLCMIVSSLEAVLLATFLMIKQTRMGYLSDRRAHLDLQINVLAKRQTMRARCRSPK